MAIDKSIMWSVLIMVGMSMAVLVPAADPPTAPPAAVCYAVYMNLGMCGEYEMNGTGPSGECCYAVNVIYQYQATYPAERQTVCSCLKSVANNTSLSPPMLTRFVALPGKCGVTFPYQISPNMDCSSI